MTTLPTSRQQGTEGLEQQGVQSGFVRSAGLHPERPAIEVDGKSCSYRDLSAKSAAIAATLQRRTPPGGSPLTAVFAHRSATAFVATLAALRAGHGYVPLNRTFPPARTRWMLEASDCRSLIVDAKSEPQLDGLLDGQDRSFLVILPDRADVSGLSERWPSHSFVGGGDLAPASALEDVRPMADDIAYLLFTSGSTGTPKGVMVTHGNVSHFVAAAAERYQITEHDRFSQMFDLTFDLSVFDMFVAWSRGACVCCPSEGALLNPDKFIRDSQPTVWLSVPSVGVFMKRFGALRAGRFPSLRWSLFCGEPLPVEVAQAWIAAAPASTLENLYGPTEVTVACSAYRWCPERSAGESRLGIVPIGSALPGLETLIVDEALCEVTPGTVGELLMAGPQVTPGYWRDAETTRRFYVRPQGRSQRFYRTGDRVRRPAGNEPMTFVGRTDDQVKVRGFRVELGEVEAQLREEAGVASAAAIPWPVTASGAGGVVAFVTGADINATALRERIQKRLPHYAVPRAIRVLSSLPLNANGKTDRRALTEILKKDDAAGT